MQDKIFSSLKGIKMENQCEFLKIDKDGSQFCTESCDPNNFPDIFCPFQKYFKKTEEAANP